MAVSRHNYGTVSGGISQGINLEERYSYSSSERDDLIADFHETVHRRLRNRLSHISTTSDLSMVANGLKFMLKEKLEAHQMQRRRFWNTQRNYQSTCETSCAINDSGTTELFMFKISGGVKITEKYRLFMRFVKYDADLDWRVMSLRSSSAAGSRQLRGAFNTAMTSDDGGRRIDDAMNALASPRRNAINASPGSDSRRHVVEQRAPSWYSETRQNHQLYSNQRQTDHSFPSVPGRYVGQASRPSPSRYVGTMSQGYTEEPHLTEAQMRRLIDLYIYLELTRLGIYSNLR